MAGVRHQARMMLSLPETVKNHHVLTLAYYSGWVLFLEQCFDSGLYLNLITRIETAKLFDYLTV